MRFYHMDAVSQTINQRSGQSGVTGERLGPVGKRQIGGDDQAALFVAAAEEAEFKPEPSRASTALWECEPLF